MNLQGLLESFLKNAGGMAQKATPSSGTGKVAAGAALGLLLGTQKGRQVGGKVLKYGSVAALGALAWHAYQEHQARQSAGTAPVAAGPSPGAASGFAALPAPQQEQHSRAMLKAMIAAAKADGHVDEQERERLYAELQRSDADDDTRRWVQAELNRPVDPAEVAAAASGPEMAAEIYLASVVMADETGTMERAYLDELARQLRLAPALKADLERRAAAV